MSEEEHRAEMAKQARIRNLIELRRLCIDSTAVRDIVRQNYGINGLVAQIERELELTQ